VTFRNKYDERTERMSIRVPTALKDHIWKAARRSGMSATDVVISALSAHFNGAATTKKDKANEKDIFA